MRFKSSSRIRNIFTKHARRGLGIELKTSKPITSVSILLSSSCEGGFRKVLNWTSKGR